MHLEQQHRNKSEWSVFRNIALKMNISCPLMDIGWNANTGKNFHVRFAKQIIYLIVRKIDHVSIKHHWESYDYYEIHYPSGG